MPEIQTDQHHITHTRNLSRYFVETRGVAWVLLIIVLAAGAFSYKAMEKRKDPLYSNLYAATVCAWPGASADKVEELITKKIEEKVSENMKVIEIKSVSRSNVSIITMKIDDRIGDTSQQFDDLNERVASINDLPSGAGPIIFMKDYGDVATLMLTVASPPADDVDVSLRVDQLKRVLGQDTACAHRRVAKPDSGDCLLSARRRIYHAQTRPRSAHAVCGGTGCFDRCRGA